MARHGRVVVAMSGGVDSSVAAYLLKQQQYKDVVGLFMSNWDARDEDEEQARCNELDYKDCQDVCKQLNIPLNYASFAAEYWTGVFEPYVDSIARGNMPNPDVGCNSVIKFGAMKEYAHGRLKGDNIATGHYARLWHKTTPETSPESELMETILSQDSNLSEWLPNCDSPILLAGADLTKDQSYFLSRVSGDSFRNVLFPLGNYQKNSSDNETTTTTTTTRQLAKEAGLHTVSNKRESMGICFVGKRQRFASFIQQYLPQDVATSGDFINVDSGEVVGRYNNGVYQYVVGQGAKIGGASQKWFVAGRDGNNVLVCGGTHHPALYANALYIRDMHWINGGPPPPLRGRSRSMRAHCRIRHLQPLIPCEILWSGDSHYTIRFDTPVRAITPGQVAALYAGPQAPVCLGGGVIWDRGPSFLEMGLQLPRVLHPAGHNDESTEKRKIQQEQTR